MNLCKVYFLAAILIAGLAACATDRSFNEGKRLLAEGSTEEGLSRIEEAIRENPGNQEYRAYFFRERERLVAKTLEDAESMRQQGKHDAAEAGYARVFRLDPNNQRVRAAILNIQSERRWADHLAAALMLFDRGDTAGAETRLRVILTENPAHEPAKALMAKVAERRAAATVPSVSRAALAKPITLEFRDANIRTVFDVIARTSGMNFAFDKDVRTDTKVTIFVRNSTVEDVIKLILTTNQLESKSLNENSMLIYPNTAAKQKEYTELVVRSFSLSNADAKQTLNMIRAVIKTRDLYVDEKLNLLVMRDTPAAIRLAEKMIATQDMAEPEVVLEVEVLEIKRSRLTDLGIQFPNQITVLNIVPTPTTVTTAGGVVTQTSNATTTTSQLTWESIRGWPRSNQLGITNPQINLRSEDGDTNLLANPRIRVKNREKAKIHIGDKVPVITTTSTANVGVSESVNYLDVGLKLDVETQVNLEDEVSIKVGLEVSSIVREIRSTAGTLTYQVGTRNASTALRLRNGETQALAGLINDEDRRSASRLPGLGDLPILGRLFSSERNEKVKTEIVLLITPRIVRNLPRPEFNVAEFPAGTENTAGAQPLAIRPSAPGALRLSTQVPGGVVPRAPGAAAIATAASQAVEAPAQVEALSLVLSGSAKVAPGAELGVGVSIPAGAQRGEISLAYDASTFTEVRPPGSAAGDPGRIVFRLEQANEAATSFTARLRASGGNVAASPISVDAASLRDATGRELAVSLPPVLQVQVAP